MNKLDEASEDTQSESSSSPPSISGEGQDEGLTFLLRLTSGDVDTKDKLRRFLDPISNRYIIAREISKKGVIHFHCWITDLKAFAQIDQFRAQFRYEFTKEIEGGANRYTLQVAKKPVSGAAYATKDKDFYSKGIEAAELELIVKQGYKKYSKQDLKERIGELDNKLVSTEHMKAEEYIIEYQVILADYKLPCKWDYARARAEMLLIRKYGPDMARLIYNKKYLRDE